MGAPNSAMARSTMSMARSTPAQKPLGFASSIRMPRRLTFSARALGNRGALGAAAFQDGVEDHAHRADGYGGIGDVEGRERRRPPVQVQEVDHVAMLDAIDDVADGA